MDAAKSDHNVLIVEDELVARHALAALLGAAGYGTRAVASAESALEGINMGERLEFALVDLDLPGMNGAEFIDRLAAEQPWVFSVLISAASPSRVALLLAEGVPYLRKPLNFQELLKVLHAHSRSH